jgi:copper chaperone CopZ
MRFIIIVVLASVIAVSAVGCSKQSDSTATPAAQKTTFPAGEQTLYFTVNGMHCEGCANTIAGTAKTLDGVIDCTVDFDTKYATLHVEDGPIAQDVMDEIAKYDYTLTPTDTPPPAPADDADAPNADAPEHEPEAEPAAA